MQAAAEDAVIEHMFAMRGLSTRTRPAEADARKTQATNAAQALRHAWHDVSCGYGAAFGAEPAQAALKPYAEHTLARDAQGAAEAATTDALDTWSSISAPFSSQIFAPLAYPITSAYPRIFRHVTRDGRPLHDAHATPSSVPIVASLRTSESTLPMLLAAREFVVGVLAGHEPLAAYGIGSAPASAGRAATDESEGCVGGRDGLIDVRETLEQLCDAYGGVINDDAEPGTDEEWADDAWDL